MPVTVEVCEDGYVLLQTYLTPLTLEEIQNSFSATLPHRNSVQHSVHALIDMRNMGQFPFGILRLRISPSLTHPRSGRLVVVGANYLTRKLIVLTAQFAGSGDKLQFFETLDSAWVFLSKRIQEEKQSETLRK
jgi:hypothetical protein